jgi:EpsI family protein
MMRGLDRRCVAMLVVLLGGQLAAWATRPSPGPDAALAVGKVPLRAAGWRGQDLGPYDEVTMKMLAPDAYLNREYVSDDGLRVHLAAIYGHRKTTFHSPGFCLLGGGWNITSKSRLEFRPTGGRPVPLNRFVLNREGREAVVLYYYVEDHRATTSWVTHQAYLAWDRLRRGRPVGALVRLTVPVISTAEDATQRGIGLLKALHPSLVGVGGA